jgi:hypothetical protein
MHSSMMPDRVRWTGEMPVSVSQVPDARNGTLL